MTVTDRALTDPRAAGKAEPHPSGHAVMSVLFLLTFSAVAGVLVLQIAPG